VATATLIHATRRATIARQLRDLVHTLARIQDRISLRRWLGLGQTQMGARMGQHRLNSHAGRPLHKTTVGHLEHGDYAIPRQREIYQAVLDEAVRAESGGLLSVRLDRRYRVVVYRRYNCGHTARYERANYTRCPRCREHS
jgi:hypothetical protein